MVRLLLIVVALAVGAPLPSAQGHPSMLPLSTTTAHQCSPATIEKAIYIIAGKVSAPGQWPFMAHLQLRGQALCSSSVISPRHILIAAHCNDSGTATAHYSIVAGTNNISQAQGENGTVVVGLNAIAIHPDYGHFAHYPINDLAVLTLDKKLNFTKTLSSIALSARHFDGLDHTEALIAGWGMTGREPEPQFSP